MHDIDKLLLQRQSQAHIRYDQKIFLTDIVKKETDVYDGRLPNVMATV
jgi:hypothetical protein